MKRPIPIKDEKLFNNAISVAKKIAGGILAILMVGISAYGFLLLAMCAI